MHANVFLCVGETKDEKEAHGLRKMCPLKQTHPDGDTSRPLKSSAIISLLWIIVSPQTQVPRDPQLPFGSTLGKPITTHRPQLPLSSHPPTTVSRQKPSETTHMVHIWLMLAVRLLHLLINLRNSEALKTNYTHN